MKKLRWGFLSTANIGRKNWQSIRNTENNVLVAVASRDAVRARKFIEECQAAEPFETPPKALGSYEELIASPEVDAIYVPLPTALRREWIVRAANAGKHILCEKPCAVNLAELDAMLAACRANRVQFLDGVMFMHHPRMSRLRAALDDAASVGDIRRIMATFSFNVGEAFFKNDIRLQSALEPTGSLGDLGWYCIRIILWAMKWQMPVEANGRILSATNSVPTEFSGELVFAGGASAGFYCSFLAPNQKWVNISGTKGWLRVDDFVLPPNAHEYSFELNGQMIPVKCCDCASEHSQSRVMSQHANMFRNFANQVFSGLVNEEWLDWARKTQQVMDACLASARRNPNHLDKNL